MNIFVMFLYCFIDDSKLLFWNFFLGIFLVFIRNIYIFNIRIIEVVRYRMVRLWMVWVMLFLVMVFLLSLVIVGFFFGVCLVWMGVCFDDIWFDGLLIIFGVLCMCIICFFCFLLWLLVLMVLLFFFFWMIIFRRFWFLKLFELYSFIME